MLYRRARRDRRLLRLLDATRRGNRRACRLLYRSLFPPVSRYLAARIRNREDVEDLTSRVFHRFLERLDDFDPARGGVLAWILTMAHHALVDHYRERSRMVPCDGLEPGMTGPAEDPLAGLIREERARRLHGMLVDLPAETRRMLALRFEQDLRYREIAACLGITEEAVKQRFSRILRTLRARWKAPPGGNKEVDYAV